MRASIVMAFALAMAGPLRAQDTAAVRASGDSVSVRFVDADLRAVIQALGRHLDRPVLFAGLPGARVSLETPRPVPRAALVSLLRGLLESQGLELAQDSAYYRIRQRDPAASMPRPVGAPATAPAQGGTPELTVVRLRHARAADVAATLSALYGAAGGPVRCRRSCVATRSRPSIRRGSPARPPSRPRRGPGSPPPCSRARSRSSPIR
jgi:type II secretory pathway component GspD/PulD (secretin)